MKDDPSRVPPPPITLELRERLAEIIAERPPQQITWMLSGRLGEIVAERIAGLPLEQRTEVAQLTILEVLMTRQEVPLIGLLRRHVAQELARSWILPEELKKIYRRRDAKFIENLYFLAKWSRKTTVAGQRLTALKVVTDALRFLKKDGRWTGRGFHSSEALWQWLKRERWARKKPQP